MNARHLRVVGKLSMAEDQSVGQFFLIVADHDQGIFSVEGPMIDDRPWKDAALSARNNERHVECGPAGPDRDALAIDYHRAHKLPGVPPGTIVRARQ
jgi:hypothetical protein